MQYNWDQWNLYINISYSHEYGKIREYSTQMAYNTDNHYLTIGHTYKEVLSDQPNFIPANDMTLTFGYTVNEQVELTGGFAYDVDDSSNSQWRFGGSYYRDCWSVSASVSQEITPRPTGYTTDSSFYLQLNFIPFGSVGSGDEAE